MFAELDYRPRHPLDLVRVVGFFARGGNDPTMLIEGGVIWRALRTPEGIATVALRESAPGVVTARAWGDGRHRALQLVPALCGEDDDPSSFDPGGHPVLRRAHHNHPGLRLGRTGAIFDALVSAILEQKVTGLQAFGAWGRLVRTYGERAPGPTPRALFTTPTISGWRAIPSWSWHRAGVEPSQSRTVMAATHRGESLVRAVAQAPDSAARDRALQSIPGVGPWTSAEVRIRAMGDPDAVSVGDFHLAHEIGHALAGARTDDAGMLTLLSAWPGHRQRVIRLLAADGVREPRRGARLHPEDHRMR